MTRRALNENSKRVGGRLQRGGVLATFSILCDLCHHIVLVVVVLECKTSDSFILRNCGEKYEIMV